MRLRDLEIKDAVFMSEWMQDRDIVGNQVRNFSETAIEDCERFILSRKQHTDRIDKAIVSDTDEYMGTVSLKNIDSENKNAEFSIMVRACAISRGYAWYAMKKMLEMAFSDLGLSEVYWCVPEKNERAVRFFDKHNFKKAVDVPARINSRYPGNDSLEWYVALSGDTLEAEDEVAGCRVIHIKTIPTVGAGELSFFETNRSIPFGIKRIYYISKVPEGVRRGFHAHKELKQLLFCPYGEIQLVLDEGKGRQEITLSDPSIGVILDHPVWREMLWIQKDSVLCVAVSDYYDESDYIRSYPEFLEYINKEAVSNT